MPKRQTPKYDFPQSVSYSSLSNAKGCDKMSEYYTFQRIVPVEKSIDLHAGGVFASGIEAVRKAFHIDGVSAEAAIITGVKKIWKDFGDFEVPEKSAKSWLNLTHALIGYFDEWPLATDPVQPLVLSGATAIEFEAIAELDVKHPSTGDPILYTCRSDMLGSFGGSLWNVDEKTTSGIGPAWARKWALSSQFFGTKWVASQYGYKLKGTIVRGIAILKYENKTVEHMAVTSQFMVDRWYEATVSHVKRLIHAWETNDFPYNFDHNCNAFNRVCDYAPLCLAQDAKQWGMYFTQRTR